MESAVARFQRLHADVHAQSQGPQAAPGIAGDLRAEGMMAVQNTEVCRLSRVDVAAVERLTARGRVILQRASVTAVQRIASACRTETGMPVRLSPFFQAG